MFARDKIRTYSLNIFSVPLNQLSFSVFDIFILTKLESKNIEISTLQIALRETAEKRGTYNRIKEFNQVIEMIELSDIMRQRWDNYSKKFSYVEDIKFEETCEAIKKIFGQLKL